MISDEKGSATIEITIIMSVFLVIIISSVYMAFYFHDVTVIRSVCMKNCEDILYKEDKENFAANVKGELDKKLFVIKNINVTGKVSSKVKVSVTGEYEGCGKSAFAALNKDVYKFSYESKRRINKDDIYKVKALKRVVDKLEGSE